MTRTEYTNAIRRAGFSVRPLWQARSDIAGRNCDLTCYAVHAASGAPVTQLILRDWDGGVDAFFACPGLRVSDDIACLEQLVAQAAPAPALA